MDKEKWEDFFKSWRIESTKLLTIKKISTAITTIKHKYCKHYFFCSCIAIPIISTTGNGEYLKYLPWHRGCTFFQEYKDHYIIGCDYDHGGDREENYTIEKVEKDLNKIVLEFEQIQQYKKDSNDFLSKLYDLCKEYNFKIEVDYKENLLLRHTISHKITASWEP